MVTLKRMKNERCHRANQAQSGGDRGGRSDRASGAQIPFKAFLADASEEFIITGNVWPLPSLLL